MSAKSKRGRNVLIAATSTVVAVALLAWSAVGSQPSADAAQPTPSVVSPSASPSPSPSAAADALDPELIKLLTVSTISDTAQCETDQYDIVEFDVAALKGIPPRKTADAISTPFKATEPADIRAELQSSICEDPLLGSTWGAFFANQVADTFKKEGIDIVELNPWLKEFVDADIATVAGGYIPLLDISDPSAEQIDAALAKNRDWQDQASRLNTLLERYEALDVETRNSSVTYHVIGPVVGALPAVGLDPKVDRLPALVFSFTEKNGCSVSEFGVNLQDKRPELFTPDCSKPPTSTPPPTTPPCTSNCTPPPVPCVDVAKPHDAEHIYASVKNAKGCIIRWVVTGTSLDSGPQSQDVQTDRGGQAEAQVQPPEVPSTAPAPNPVVPAVTADPADPVDGGLSGGSTTQPGQTGTPDPGPTQPPVSGDSGGF